MLTICATFLGALLIAAAPAMAVPGVLLDFIGFDYTFPVPGGDFAAPGNYYEAVGIVVDWDHGVLNLNNATHQITFYLLSDFIATADTFGTTLVFSYLPSSRIFVYEDLIAGGTAYDYGTNPQNATAPLSFVDGTLVLTGQIPDLTIVTDATTLNGSLSGTRRGSSGGLLPRTHRTDHVGVGATTARSSGGFSR